MNFYWNQTEIAELFCVNKEKPQLKCDGKCHLKTELTKTDTNNEVPFSQNNNEYSIELIFDINKNEDEFFNSSSTKEKWFSYKKAIISRDIQVVSPPPKV